MGDPTLSQEELGFVATARALGRGAALVERLMSPAREVCLAELGPAPAPDMWMRVQRLGAMTLGRSLAGAPSQVIDEAALQAGACAADLRGAALRPSDAQARETARRLVRYAASLCTERAAEEGPVGKDVEGQLRLGVLGAVAWGRALAGEGQTEAAAIAATLPLRFAEILLREAGLAPG